MTHSWHCAMSEERPGSDGDRVTAQIARKVSVINRLLSRWVGAAVFCVEVLMICVLSAYGLLCACWERICASPETLHLDVFIG